jgi:integrase
METMTKYLCKRPGSPNWHVRLPVPNALKAKLGKQEITKSTGTSDRKTAETFAMKFVSEQREMFARELAELDSVIPLDPNGKVVELYYQKFLEELKQRKRDHGRTREAYSAWCEEMKRERDEFVRLANIEDYDRIRPIAKKFVKKHGFEIRTTGSTFESLLAKMMMAIVDAFDVLLKQIAGDLDAKPSSDFVRETIAAGELKPANDERLEELLEKYATEEQNDKGRKPGNVDQMKNSVLLFIEWVGRGRNVRTLTKQDSSGFRDVLSALPRGRGKSNRLKTASITQCIEIAEKEGLTKLNPRTKNRYIADLSGFFSWLNKRGHLGENIWNGMSFHVGKNVKSYPPFSTEHLNSILRSPLYVGFLTDGKEHVAGNQRAYDWRFWIPLICMFTGARVTEVAQIYVDDIEERDGHLIGYIMADMGRGQSTKTEKSVRLVVFHPKLLAAGFATYWKQQCRRAGEDGNRQLFPELTAYEKRNELGRKPARWWGAYLQKIGVKKGADGLGTHSFRHRLADEMREAGYLNSEFGHLVMGHADGSMTARYGKVPQGTVERLSDMIESAKFVGVDFHSIVKS